MSVRQGSYISGTLKPLIKALPAGRRKSERCLRWYRGIRFSQQKERQNQNVLLLHFEDLIFNYEASLTELKHFLNFNDKDHVEKLKCFDPAQSIKNTYKFRNYPQ